MVFWTAMHAKLPKTPSRRAQSSRRASMWSSVCPQHSAWPKAGTVRDGKKGGGEGKEREGGILGRCLHTHLSVFGQLS